MQKHIHTRSNHRISEPTHKLHQQDLLHKVYNARSSLNVCNHNYTTFTKDFQTKYNATKSLYIIRGIPCYYKNRTCQSYRSLSEGSDDASSNNKPTIEKNEASPVTNKKDQFKKAVKDYGSVVVIFHLTMSWCSLGLLYIIISSGIDLVTLINGLPYIGEQLSNSTIAAGASTFVISYAI